ncbi:hypothetical protein AAULR_22444 [Lacticaseibacillus rhamnosus MTCC 5462]|nr:hypothetical protein AAULR_22444 [Lacticaseibacillus rhamnosus MTCC 5462]
MAAMKCQQENATLAATIGKAFTDQNFHLTLDTGVRGL